MNPEKITLSSFAVIGIEGSTNDGTDFVARLWQEANARYAEVELLAQKDEQGRPVGFWGAMSDFSRKFQPWEEGFSKGLYLAGVQCKPDAQPPAGWTKWILPSYECYRVLADEAEVFSKMLCWLEENDVKLAGAVQDFTDPATGQNWMIFPVRKLKEVE